ncbi:sugar transferase [Cohnella sp. REN36]|uniref:sugar transferase n=1 Tax=Cohnella sp. REN36 TaxID=2887347 RepID=UPI001D1590AD|nr:sugar transferase [Cohnella sp. REN36]MCC3375993.1 sugar transferase [Cohnella sp. REN36]
MSVDLKRSGSQLESTIGHQLEFESGGISGFAIAKRTVDIAGSLAGLLLLSPLFLLIVILMKIQEPKGAILFKQDRIGKHMKMFKILKFRSMVTNAEERLRSDPQLYRKYIQNNYKLEPDEDPRITKLGRFLRKSSLDELPQLINVLRGQMSLVGPRPIVRDELLEYGDKMMDFLSVKPGVTGYWQVSGRSNVGYPERVDLELYYAYNQSFWLDIKIIFLTFWHVLLKKGAY